MEKKIDNHPLVSIICTTYNHEKYIRQALDGFVMQQCDFPFEIIVHDDASTDKTAEIIREYVEKYSHLFNAVLQTENQYSQGKDITHLLYIEKPRGKYLALCEGDDYWTDPLKLQKQVDFLEKNPDFGMVYTKVNCFLQKTGKFTKPLGHNCVSFEDLLVRNGIPTLTVLLRSELYPKYVKDINPVEKGWLMGDYPMWLWFAANSRIHFMDITTGVYRILPESASQSSDPQKLERFARCYFSIMDFFIKYKDVKNERVLQLIYWEKTWTLFNLACMFSIERIFLEIKSELQKVNAFSMRAVYMNAVCHFYGLRIFLVLYRKLQHIIN